MQNKKAGAASSRWREARLAAARFVFGHEETPEAGETAPGGTEAASGRERSDDPEPNDSLANGGEANLPAKARHHPDPR